MKPRRLRTEAPTAPPSNAIAPADLRTVAFVGHRSSGKTTLAELALEAGRVVRERGWVDEGTTLLDWTVTSRRHHQTTELSTAWIEWHGAGQRCDGDRSAGAAGDPHVLQIVDTPGAEFLSAARDLGLVASEAAVVAIDAASGVEVGTEEAIRAALALKLPVIAVVTKADRSPSGADVADQVAAVTGARAVPLHLPLTDESGALVGIVDVLAERALRFADDHSGASSPEPLPGWLIPEVAAARERIADAAAMTDDALLEEYLEFLSLPVDKIRDGLAVGVRSRQIVPVLVTSAHHRIGAHQLLDAIAAFVPPFGAVPRFVREHDGSRTPVDSLTDGQFVATVLSEHRDDERGEGFHLMRVMSGAPPKGDWVDGRSGTQHRVRKLYRMRGPRRASAPPLVPGLIVASYDPLGVPAGTTLTSGERWELELPPVRPPMMALWVRAVHKADEARVNEALQAVIRADRGLSLLSDTTTGTTLLAGADEAHIRVAIERAMAWADGVAVATELPPVGYVETPAARVQGIEGVHVETDGDGLVEAYGKCEFALVPADPGVGTRFVDDMGDEEEDLPRRYRGAIDEGARAALRHGPTAGYPVVGAQLHLTGGAYDILQSTDDHFRLAGERGARTALERAGTRLLEPWLEIEVRAPHVAVGDLISDISAHRGRILGMEVDGPTVHVTAVTPYRELRTFANRLQALTGGRGLYLTRRSHYEAVPEHLLHEAIQASPHRRAVGR